MSTNSVLARQIGEYVACLFSKDAKVTPLSKLFPNLFYEEENKQEENDIILYKANMENFAYMHNSKKKNRKED